MGTVKVEVVNWKASALRAVVGSLIHPVALAVVDFRKGRSFIEVAIGFAILFFVYLLAQVLFFMVPLVRGATYAIVADERGLHLKAFRKSRRISWGQIATMEKSQSIVAGPLKNILTLRDATGGIQAQFVRNLQEPPLLKAQYNQLEESLVNHVGKRGVISSAPFDVAPTKSSFTFTTKGKVLGLGSLLMWLPCAYLSWSSPTGGPAVSAIFLGFAALGIFLALCDRRYEVDERGVRSSTLWKRRELLWNDIQRAALSHGEGAIYFFGDKQAVVIAGPFTWKKESGDTKCSG